MSQIEKSKSKKKSTAQETGPDLKEGQIQADGDKNVPDYDGSDPVEVPYHDLEARQPESSKTLH